MIYNILYITYVFFKAIYYILYIPILDILRDIHIIIRLYKTSECSPSGASTVTSPTHTGHCLKHDVELLRCSKLVVFARIFMLGTNAPHTHYTLLEFGCVGCASPGSNLLSTNSARCISIELRSAPLIWLSGVHSFINSSSTFSGSQRRLQAAFLTNPP